MIRAVTIVGGGLEGVAAAFEAHRQGAEAITLVERSGELGGAARGRVRHGAELRDRPFLFGPASDPLACLLESHGAPMQVFEAEGGALASLPAGGFGRMFDLCHTRLRALGVAIETGRLASPLEAVAAAEGGLAVWTPDPAALFQPLGLERPSANGRTVASYSFSAYWDGPLPCLKAAPGMGALRRAYLYESGPRTVLTALCRGEQDEESLRGEIDALMADAGGFLKVAGLLGQSLHTRWRIDDEPAMQALRGELGRRTGGRMVLAAWDQPTAADFLALRYAMAATLGEAAAERAVG